MGWVLYLLIGEERRRSPVFLVTPFYSRVFTKVNWGERAVAQKEFEKVGKPESLQVLTEF